MSFWQILGKFAFSDKGETIQRVSDTTSVSDDATTCTKMGLSTGERKLQYTYRQLNQMLVTMPEMEIKTLLDEEIAGPCRIAVLERLHQRYNTLRVARERSDLLALAGEGKHGLTRHGIPRGGS